MTDECQDAIAALLQQAGARSEPSAVQYDRARAAAEAAWQEEVRRGRRLTRRRAVAMALAAAAVVLAVLWPLGDATSPSTATVVAAITAAHGPVRVGNEFLTTGAVLTQGAILETAPGTRAALRLQNGIEVRLDVDSELALIDPERIDLSDGAVFVDTRQAKDAAARIEVRTPMGIARDIGTRFEVRMVNGAAGEDRFLRVRVRDGSVSLTTARMTLDASRGMELLATALSGEIIRTSAAMSGRDWDWVTLAAAPFDIEGKTLAEFLDWAAREGGWQVRFASDALARTASTTVLSGSIEGLSPEQALRAVLPTCGLTHEITGLVVTIQPGGTS
jgi:ferric-dicitrate binding protein FerR (iron transport regulator)